MIRKIAVEELRPGMFVADFNAGWLDHPFLRNALLLTSEAEVRKVIECGIREIFIDTGLGIDVASAPSREEAEAESERRLHAVEKAVPVTQSVPAPRVPLAEEMGRARAAHGAATQIVHKLMDDIRLGRQLELKTLTPAVERITESVIRNPNAMLTLRRLKQTDDYTFQHSVSVCTILTAFGRSLGMSIDELHGVALGGLIHDVGKVRVSSEILNKPGKLTDLEFEHMKLHVTLGEALVQGLPDVPEAAVDILRLHHERFDGSGYPRRLKGAQISQAGRMAAIVDVYDAITSDRVYHKGMGPAAAMQKVFEWSRFHFDPLMAQAFVHSIGIYPVGSLVRLESDRLAVVVEQCERKLLQPVVRVVFDARRDHYVSPLDIDLSRSGDGDRIVGNESADKWKIDVARFLACG
jgi:HD-GYP domain-containing protein (c-di-GMP phosphodiesterase class II)